MKKTFTLVLCLLLCLSMFLVGCDKKDEDKGPEKVEKVNGMTAEEVYAKALNTLKNTDSFESVSTQVIDMTYGGETVTMNQVATNRQNGHDLYSKIENDMTSAAEMEVTYVDGVLYVDQNGQKVKREVTWEQLQSSYASVYGFDMSESTLLNIPDDQFNDLTFEKEGKFFTLTFNVDGDKYTEMMGNIGISGDFTSDVEYVVYFTSEGDLEKIVITFDMEVMGVDAHCVTTTLVTIGEVTIKAPADASSYN